MSTGSSEEASASTSSSSYTNHVFLSFRGNDTGRNFSDLLYAALEQAGFHTFRDDDGIDRGDVIDAELQRAMEDSKVYIIVFSRDYASSIWCLEELVKIVEQKDRKIVVPVFYDASPDDVWDQSGSFAEAFSRHEMIFNDEMHRVERWRKALTEVAGLAGMVSRDGYEAKFIQEIVEMVKNKLKSSVMHAPLYLVGMDVRVKDINQWVQDGSKEVGVAMIYGIGGVGKTTVAKTVYNSNLDRFEASCFLANVRETLEQPDGPIFLQRQLLEKIQDGKTRKINNADEGIIEIQDAINCRKVLVVFDDVDHSDQIITLIGKWGCLCEGSKIIITTRHERLLKAHESCKKFRVKELDFNESLQLFSWYAFGHPDPTDIEDYVNHSETVVNYCCGLPLALEVLGKSLSDKDKYEWKDAIEKLEEIPHSIIQKILKRSYDSLQEDHEKSLFLDIACFFIGKDKDYVIKILDGCDFSTRAGIQNLIDRHLISRNESNELMMNRLLRDMGREIVRQESTKDPGKRSRLWYHKDVCTVLSEKIGTETIKGITLDQHTTVEDGQFTNSCVICANRLCHRDLKYKSVLKRCCLGFFSKQPAEVALTTSFPIPNMVDYETKAFAKMRNLKLLQLNFVKFKGGFENFPKSLVWLCWHGFPLTSIPSNLYLENLVVLDMCRSSLKHVWSRNKILVELKILDLSHSHGLVSTPDFSGIPNLERLMLKDCISLVKVHESIGSLERLVLVNLKDCKRLRKLPGKIFMSKSLEELYLSGCSELDKLPKDLRKMESLRVLHADGIAIKPLVPTTTLWHLTLWSWLLPRKRVQSTFSLTFPPQSLLHLSLADCNLSDDAIPNILSSLPSLRYLNLSGNAIYCLPENLNNLTLLESLLLDNCNNLQSLPELPTSLKELSVEKCTSLERVTNLPSLFRSLKLRMVGCEHLVEVQGLFKLEPIIKLDREMISNLGFIDPESVRTIEVQMSNNMTMTSRTIPLQVLHECGIHSIFLPWSEIPNWYNCQKEESTVSFYVPPVCGKEIVGFSICIVYTSTGLKTVSGEHQYIKISNTTKVIKCTYSPAFHAIPEANNDMLWLSHWKLKDLLQGEDQVIISASMSSGFQVKKCGIHLVCKKEGEDSESNCEEILPSNTHCYQSLTQGDLQAYRVRKAAFFLCNYDSLTHQELSECDEDNLKCSLLFEQ